MSGGVIKEPEYNSLGSNRGVQSRSSVNYKGADLNNILANISSGIRAKMNSISSASCYALADPSYWNENNIIKLILIQSIARKMILRRSFLKTLSKAKYRLKVINELIMTEQKYVSYLTLLYEKVYLPLKLHFSLTEQQRYSSPEYAKLSQSMQAELRSLSFQLKESDLSSLFSNLVDIIDLNSRFYEEMHKRQEKLTISGCFADVCVEFAPLLRIYVIYLNNYEKSNKTLITLTNTHESFKSLRSYLEDEELNGLDLSDYLIKPVQRLPKYALLLRDMLKNTLQSHSDYQNVKTALDTFGEVCSHNNEEMDRFIRENKLIELNRRFCRPAGMPKIERSSASQLNRIIPFSQISSALRGSLNAFSQTIFRNRNTKGKGNNDTEEIPFLLDHANEGLVIIEPNVPRQFLWEESMSLFSNNSEKRVTVYFLSDLLLVTSREGHGDRSYEILINYLYLNETSFLKNMTDLKYFSNLFRVIGRDESLTFITDTDDSKSNLIQRINKQILIPLKLRIHQRAQAEKLLQKQKQLAQEQGASQQGDNSHVSGQSGLADSYLSDKNTTTTDSQLNSSQLSMGVGLSADHIFNPIQVEVIGTEERMSSNILKLKEKYTVYITKISIGEHFQKIFIRFKEMIEVEKYVKKNIKEIKDVPHLSKSIFHGTKVIEQRKLLIENFLQKVLSNQHLRNHPKSNDLLAFIGLPQNFFVLPSNIESSAGLDITGELDILPNLPHAVSYYNDNQEDSDNEEDHLKYERGVEGVITYNNSDSTPKQSASSLAASQRLVSVGASKIYELNSSKQLVSSSNSHSLLASTVLTESRSLSASEGTDLQDTSQMQGSDIRLRTQKMQLQENNRDSQGFQKQTSLVDIEKEIEVSTLCGQQVKVQISKQSKAQDICAATAASLGMQSYLDFRILAEDEKKNTRILDDDELIYKLVFPGDFNNEVEAREGSKFNLSGLKKAVMNKLSSGKTNQKYKLRFYKYLWLEQDLEEQDYKQDPVRLNLMVAQVLSDISQLKFSLQIKEYYLYASLNIIINNQNIADALSLTTTPPKMKHSMIWNVLKNFLPSSVLRLSKENVWVENLRFFIESLYEELNSTASLIQEANKQLNEDITASNTLFKPDVNAEKKNIACLLLLKTFKQNSFYGASLFACETYKKTIKEAKNAGLKIPQNIVCSIKCDAIQILDASKQIKIKTIKYYEIKETKVFPSSITFVLFHGTHSYRFDSSQSFEISQLMIAYHRMMKNIQKNTMTLDEETLQSKAE